MAYKLFVDSDIFLDILLIREPHFSDSVSILHLRAEFKAELYTSKHYTEHKLYRSKTK